MPESPNRVLLLVPGLLGPVADPGAVAALCPTLAPLEAFLRRADTRPDAYGDRFDAARFGAFGLGGEALPAGAVSRLGEADGGTAHVGEYCWLRADPVHLRVDTHSARLFGDYVLQPGEAEADELVGRLNAHFAADGLRFDAPVPQRWYVALKENVQLQAQPPWRVAGRNIDPFLPSGADAGRWRRWLNEAQMLLHDAPANVERERDGRLPINSIWPWGPGRLPTEPLETPPAAAWADDPLTGGLSRLGEVPLAPLPAAATDWSPAAGRNLVVIEAVQAPLVHGDIEAWLAQAGEFAERWLAPLLVALEEGTLGEIELAVGGSRHFRLRREHRWRLWRRRRRWTAWLEQG